MTAETIFIISVANFLGLLFIFFRPLPTGKPRIPPIPDDAGYGSNTIRISEKELGRLNRLDYHTCEMGLTGHEDLGLIQGYYVSILWIGKLSKRTSISQKYIDGLEDINTGRIKHDTQAAEEWHREINEALEKHQRRTP